MSGCRRCKVRTGWHVTPGRGVDGMTVLADNRLQFRYRPPRKTAKELQNVVARLAQSQTATQKRSISKETGVASDSVAWQFHEMYGFDSSRDLTYDVMHELALSMFKKYTEILKRDVENNPVQRAQFMEVLTELTKKRSKVLKGRWPSDPFTRLGYFKGEEYSKFVLYCIPNILHVCNYSTDSVIAQLGRLVFEVGRLFYISSSSEQGWTIQTLERFCLLMASWRIRGEDALGATSSILDHVVGAGELLDDIYRHGPSHVYWCYTFERMVAQYNKVKPNGRNMESTFVARYACTFFNDCCTAIWKDDDGLLPTSRLRPMLQQYIVGSTSNLQLKEMLERNIVVVPNQSLAKCICDALELDKNQLSQRCLATYDRGIGVGTRRSRRCEAERCHILYLRKFWAGLIGMLPDAVQISSRLTRLKSVMVRGVLYRSGDYVLVSSR
ncbi:hypothetical protein R1sor_005127 [Riccia sorocarpa]|uniref:Uncharacterized protein n=1 Tax=Riccia sorocarpa TaxID=122646 RepID=A0ABD3HKW7_9MARC